MASAALALAVANSPQADTYFAVLKAYVGPRSVLHWINDALMAVLSRPPRWRLQQGRAPGFLWTAAQSRANLGPH